MLRTLNFNKHTKTLTRQIANDFLTGQCGLKFQYISTITHLAIFECLTLDFCIGFNSLSIQFDTFNIDACIFERSPLEFGGMLDALQFNTIFYRLSTC